LAAILEDDPQQLRYFARDFLADRFGCFFSWAVRPSGSAVGRKRQIFWFTWMNSSLSS
jgi:hypothetical protein